MKNSNNKKYLKMMEKRNRALSREYKKIYKEEYDEKIKLLRLAIKEGENKIKSDITSLSKEISALEYDISGSDKYAQVYGAKLAILKTEYLRLNDLLNNYSSSQEVKEIESKIIMEENLYRNIDNNLLVINSNSTTLNDISIISEEDPVKKSVADELDLNSNTNLVKETRENLEKGSVTNPAGGYEDNEIKIGKHGLPAKSKFKLFRKRDTNIDLNIEKRDDVGQRLVSDYFDSYIEEVPYLKDRGTPILKETVTPILNNNNSEKLIDDSPPLIDEAIPLIEDNLKFAKARDEVEPVTMTTAIEGVSGREVLNSVIGAADGLEVAQPIKKKFKLFRKDRKSNKKEFEMETSIEQVRLDASLEGEQYLDEGLQHIDLDSYEKENEDGYQSEFPKFSKMETNEDTASAIEYDSLSVEVPKTSKKRFRFFRKRVKDHKNEKVAKDLRKESGLDSGIEKDSFLDDLEVTNLEGSVPPNLDETTGSYIEAETEVVTEPGYESNTELETHSVESISAELAREGIEISNDAEVNSQIVDAKNNKRFKLFGKKVKGTPENRESIINNIADNELYNEIENKYSNRRLEGDQVSYIESGERVLENSRDESSLSIDLSSEGAVEIKSQESGITGDLPDNNEKKSKFKKLKNIISKEKSDEKSIEKEKFNPSFDIEITTANTSISEYDYSTTSPNLGVDEVPSTETESNIGKPVSINISEDSFTETIYIEKSKKELKKERKAINKEAKRNKKANIKIDKENKRLEVIKEKERAAAEKFEREELEKLEKDQLKEIARKERDNAQAEKRLSKEVKSAEKRERKAIKLANKLASKEERNKQRLLVKEERRKKSAKRDVSLLDNSTVISDELTEEGRGVESSIVREPELENLAIKDDRFEEDVLLKVSPELIEDEITLSITEELPLLISSESEDKKEQVVKARLAGLFKKKKDIDVTDNSELVSENEAESNTKPLGSSVVNVEYILDESVESEKRDNYEESKKLTNEKIKNAEEKHRIKLEKQERKDRKKNEKLKAKAERSERRQLEKNRKQEEKDFANQQLAEIKQRSKNAIEAEKLLYESESELNDSAKPKSNFIKGIFERRKINKELKRSIREELKESQSDDRVNSTGDGSLSKEEKRRLKVQLKEEKARIKKAKSDQSHDERRKNKEISIDNKRDKKIESADKNRLKVERDELKKSFKNTKKIEEARRREAKELAKIEEKRIAAIRKVESDNIKAQNKIESEKIKKEKEYKKEILAQQKYKSKQQRSLLKEETKINKRAQKIDLPKLRSVNTDEENSLGGSYQWDAESGVFSESDSGSGINFMEYDLPEQLPRR